MKTFEKTCESVDAAIKMVKKLTQKNRLCDLRRYRGTFYRAAMWLNDECTNTVQLCYMPNGVVLAYYGTAIKYNEQSFAIAVATLSAQNSGACVLNFVIK